jgi:hypothetical protein
MTDILIDDDYRNAILKSPNILAVLFIDSQPRAVLSKDPRCGYDVSQVVLTREEVLGDFVERTKANSEKK